MRIFQAYTDIKGVTFRQYIYETEEEFENGFYPHREVLLFVDREFVVTRKEDPAKALETIFGKCMDIDGMQLLRCPDEDQYFMRFDPWKGFNKHILLLTTSK